MTEKSAVTPSARSVQIKQKAPLDLAIALSGVWIYDIRRDTMTPLTGERNAGHPVWTPDGKYIVYTGATGISSARADGGSKAQSLTEDKEFQYPTAFSPDGKRLVFHRMGHKGTTFGSCRSNMTKTD
jgi:Tol biopolymer transport system component